MNATAVAATSYSPVKIASAQAPGSIWQAYALALNLNEAVSNCIYSVPARGRKNKMYKEALMREGKKEAAVLKQRMQYYLNMDLYNFYQSGGQLIASAEANNNIPGAIDYFISSLSRRTEVQYQVDTITFFKEIRNDLCRLYKILADSYIDLEMQQVFNEICVLSKQSNYNVHNSLEVI